MKVRALAAASVLFFFGATAGAQTTPIRCGLICTPNDVHEWANSNFGIVNRNLKLELDKLRGAAELLAKDLELERKQTAADVKTTSDALVKTSDSLNQLRVQAQELEKLIQAREQLLRQELAKQMDGRFSEIATQVLQQLGRIREELAKLSGESAELRGGINRLEGIVTELQKDRREFERSLLSFKGDQKNLDNRLTLLESRKTDLDELRSALRALQVSSKADLDNAKGQSENVRVELERRVDDLTETLRQTQAAGEKAKLDFERQLSVMREEFRLGVEAIRKEMNAQVIDTKKEVTDTKKEVTEIRRSTAPVTVEVDGRPFEALAADRDSYQAAISRVMNAPKAKTPREEYEAARADVQKFMDSVANPGFRGSSFFWLGMAQAGAGQCREALVSFEEMRKLVDTVRHPRYPTAMLQKATCQLMLKEPQDRINRSVKELMDQFPGTPEAESAKALLPPPRKNR